MCSLKKKSMLKEIPYPFIMVYSSKDNCSNYGIFIKTGQHGPQFRVFNIKMSLLLML